MSADIFKMSGAAFCLAPPIVGLLENSDIIGVASTTGMILALIPTILIQFATDRISY